MIDIDVSVEAQKRKKTTMSIEVQSQSLVQDQTPSAPQRAKRSERAYETQDELGLAENWHAATADNSRPATADESPTINASFRTAPPAQEREAGLQPGPQLDPQPSPEPTPARDSAQAPEAIASPKPRPMKPTRYIRVRVRDEVRLRDMDQCTYADPTTGLRCTSRHGLQSDHITAYAFGGENSAANLRLRCPAHNQLQAIAEFGRKHMEQYIFI